MEKPGTPADPTHPPQTQRHERTQRRRNRHPQRTHRRIEAQVSGWGGVFGDQVVAAAMIDRIVHHADVLTLKGASYRLRNRGIDTLPSIKAEQGSID